MSEPSAITGLPDPQRGHPGGRNARRAALDREAVLLEDAGQIARRLDFLEAELAEAEDRVDHLLRQLGHLVDALDRFGLVARSSSRCPGAADGAG